MRRSLPLAVATAIVLTTASFAPALAADGGSSSSSGGGMQMGELVPYVSGQFIIPFGDLGDVANVGLGVGGGVAASFSDAVTGRAELSILKPFGKDFGGFDYSVWVIPVSALVQFSPTPGTPFYITGGLSIVFLRYSWEGDFTYFNGAQIVTEKQSYDDTETKIGISGGAGYEVADNIFLEGSLNLVEHGSSLTAGGRFEF